MDTTGEYDVVIIGAGPGGYVAGIRASQLGLKACVIEKNKPGGVCLNEGCIPTKSLVHQAGLFRAKAALEDMGIAVDTGGFDYSRVFQKSRKAAEALSQGVEFLLRKNSVQIIRGTARIAAGNRVALDDGSLITGRNIIIATGSRPKELPGFPFDEKTILTSTGAIFLSELPKKLMIIGGGAIGCEFASIMNAFGVEVILVEILDRILPMEDAETVAVLARAFRRRGIVTMTSVRAVAMKQAQDGASITVEKQGSPPETVTVDKILIVTGRTPNTDDIGLDSIGIDTVNGFIPVGDYCRTAVPGVFAIGDVTSTPLLAHVAMREGEIAVEYIAGIDPEPSVNPETVPSAVFTDPQIAGYGLTEEAARARGIDYSKAVFPYRGCGKSVADENTDGVVKVITDNGSGRIIGAHIAGAQATELIHELLLTSTAGLLPGDVIRMIHAHPTLSELAGEVMRALEGRAIHA